MIDYIVYMYPIAKACLTNLCQCVFVCVDFCLFCCLTSQVNSYGHDGTVKSPNHTFSWASLNKQLTSTLCTYFGLQLTTLLDWFSKREENDRRNYFMINLHESMGPGIKLASVAWHVTDCATRSGKLCVLRKCTVHFEKLPQKVFFLPLSFVMVILFSFPVLLSVAETFMIPLASISNVTSIWGTPLGAGGMPVSSNFPRRLLSLVIALSPSYTWMSTPGWLSE